MIDKVIAALLTYGDLPARIGNRFGPLVLPAEGQTPYVSWEVTSRSNEALNGHTNLRRHDVLFACWGISRTQASATAEAVKAVLTTARGWFGGYEVDRSIPGDLSDGVEAPEGGGERGVFHVDVPAAIWLRR